MRYKLIYTYTHIHTHIQTYIYHRFFHIKMSDLNSYVGEFAQRVWVHAQTVVIDANVDVDYSLTIRARQIIIDRSKALFVRVRITLHNFRLHWNIFVMVKSIAKWIYILTGIYLCGQSLNRATVRSRWRILCPLTSSLHNNSGWRYDRNILIHDYQYDWSMLNIKTLSKTVIYHVTVRALQWYFT